MARTSFADWPCSVARTVDIFGDAWSVLILREAFAGVRRFDDFQRNLSISRNILTKRLNVLCEHGVFAQHLYQEHPDRYEYRLTESGVDMFPVIMAIMAWGDKWLFAGEDVPLEIYDRETDERMHPVVVDEHSGRPIVYQNTMPRLGPGHPRFESMFKDLHSSQDD